MGYFIGGKRCKGQCGRRDGRTPSGDVRILNADGYCPTCVKLGKDRADGRSPGQMALSL